jgi:hypothetical protein
VKLQRGEVIIVMHQYTYTGKGKKIHSSGQLEWYKQEVDDKSIKVGGKQHIKTSDGYVIPLDVKGGLPYVKMRPYTDHKWDPLPHVILTRDGNWNPSVVDHSLTDDEQWYDAVSDFPDAMDGSPSDAEGNYRNLHVFDLFITDSILDNHIIPDLPWLYQAHEHQTLKTNKISLSCAPTLPGFLRMLSKKPSRTQPSIPGCVLLGSVNMWDMP